VHNKWDIRENRGLGLPPVHRSVGFWSASRQAGRQVGGWFALVYSSRLLLAAAESTRLEVGFLVVDEGERRRAQSWISSSSLFPVYICISVMDLLLTLCR
jgi:hypothetical protein